MLHADDAGIVSKSAEGLAKIMTVIVTVFTQQASQYLRRLRLCYCEPDQAPCTSPLVIEAAGQRYRQTTQFLYMGGLIDAIADIMPEIKRRVQLACACYSRFKRKLYDMAAAPFALKLRILKVEVMETLRYGCVT